MFCTKTETMSLLLREEQAQQHANTSSNASAASGQSASRWMFCQHDFSSIQQPEAKDAALFDNQSTDHFFSNDKLVDGVRSAKSGVVFNTNGGSMMVKIRAANSHDNCNSARASKVNNGSQQIVPSDATGT